MKECLLGIWWACLIGAFGGSTGGLLTAYISNWDKRKETNAAIEKLREEYRRSK